MMKRQRYFWGQRIILVAAIVFGPEQFGSAAESPSDTDKTKLCAELGTLFASARAVISQNQGLINDASKADKGLSGEAVVGQVKQLYQKNSGEALPEGDAGGQLATDARNAMLDAIAEVMDANQILINEKGVGFKGFLPAVFAKMVADRFSKKMAGRIALKLTAPSHLIRNRANRPDEWESRVMTSSFSGPEGKRGKDFAERAAHKKGVGLRYMVPEYYAQSCLDCHGEPKGSRDITGGLKEGGKIGELGGAISIVIFD